MAKQEFIIIGPQHVRQKLINAFGKLWWVNECIGPKDVGKKLFRKNGTTLRIEG